MSELLAASCVCLAVLLSIPAVDRIGVVRSRDRPSFPFTAQAVASASVGLVLFVLDFSWVIVVLFLGVATALGHAVRRRRERRVAARRRGQVLVACEGLAADLAAGLGPHQALGAMAATWRELRPVADAAAVGADVPEAFRAVATLPGASMLRVVAAAWSVSARAGSSLAGALELAAGAIRAEEATARVVAAETAAALATARLLALLPLAVLALGRGLGGDPLRFLFVSMPGQVCLTVGGALVWLGSLWLQRITDQVEAA